MPNMYALVPYPPFLLPKQFLVIIARAFFAVLRIQGSSKPPTLQIRLLCQPIGIAFLRIRRRAGGVEGGAVDEAPPSASLVGAADVIAVARNRWRYRSLLALCGVDGGTRESSSERWRKPRECVLVVFIFSSRLNPS